MKIPSSPIHAATFIPRYVVYWPRLLLLLQLGLRFLQVRSALCKRKLQNRAVIIAGTEKETPWREPNVSHFTFAWIPDFQNFHRTKTEVGEKGLGWPNLHLTKVWPPPVLALFHNSHFSDPVHKQTLQIFLGRFLDATTS